MFSDERLTRFHFRWAILLFGLFSLTLLSIDVSFRLNEQVGVRVQMQNADGSTARDAMKTPVKQSAPESTVKNLVLAWNRGDSEAVARLFLPHGVLVLPTGSVIRSRSEIRKRILHERKDRLKESILRNTVEDVSLVDSNTAMVRGKYILDGMQVMGIRTSPEGPYILRQKKQQGTWMIEKAEVLGKKKRVS